MTDGTLVTASGGTLAVYSENKNGFISGGRFSSDSSTYVVDSKIIVAEDGMYGIQEEVGTVAEASEGEPDVDVPESLKEHAEELEKVLAGVDTTGLTGGANDVANDNQVTEK